MKKLQWIIWMLLPVLTMAQKQIINDPNVQPRTVGSFHAIKVTDAVDLFISQGETEALAVSAANTEYRDNIKTVVEDGVLKISFDDNNKWFRNSNKKLRAYISFKTLDRLTASSASDVVINGTIKVTDLVISMNGASDLKMNNGSIEANKLDISLSGASDATMNGKVATLKLDCNGASDFKGFDMIADFCEVEASGASDVQVTVNKELNARASGASDVRYKGDGVIRDLKTSGASSVSRRG